MFNNLLLVVQVLFFVIGAYQVILSFFGWYRKKERITHKPTKSFALLVAAHNEKAVVGALIENLLKMDYPRELFDIFVICDNCTDGTADIVRKYPGVHACERTNPRISGAKAMRSNGCSRNCGSIPNNTIPSSCSMPTIWWQPTSCST